jgi:tetratricopeptide (TPR) repeat protein
MVKGDYDGAIADSTKAIELKPNYAEAYADRGLTKLGQGKDAEAQQDLDTALKLDSSLKTQLEKMVNQIKQTRKPNE